MKEEKFLIRGVECNFKVAGEGNPLLILHGWGGSSDSWTEVSRKLAANGYKVVCPDLPGFGKNPPPLKPWSTKDYFAWVKDYIEKNIDSNFFLLGHSFGGKIAIPLSLEMEDKISGLILIAPAIFSSKANLRGKIFATLWKIIFPLISLFLKFKIFKKLYNFLRYIFYSFFLRNPQYLKLNLTMRKTIAIVNKEDFSSLLSKIKVKTLILWGENDKILPLKQAFLIKEKLKNADLKILKKVGHSPNLQTPDLLGEIIFQFVKSYGKNFY